MLRMSGVQLDLHHSQQPLQPDTQPVQVWYNVNTGEYWLEDGGGRRAICGAVPRDGLPSTSDWLSKTPQSVFEQAVYLHVLRHNRP